MQYENRQPPEGINVETHGWVGDFVLLVAGSLLGLVVVSWLLLQAVGWSARWVPFSWEQALTRSWSAPQPDEKVDYLQSLASNLAQAGELDESLSLIVRHSDDPSVNAFATLGGNMVILQGLLEAVESEQGLAFVIAHELAHVHFRHPARAIARGLTLELIGALVFGGTDLRQIAGMGGQLTLLDYSRRQEAQADAWALDALYRHYGHVQGATELFLHLSKDSKTRVRRSMPEWLESHPELTQRIAALENRARERGYPLEGTLTPLPARLDNTSVSQLSD